MAGHEKITSDGICCLTFCVSASSRQAERKQLQGKTQLRTIKNYSLNIPWLCIIPELADCVMAA